MTERLYKDGPCHKGKALLRLSSIFREKHQIINALSRNANFHPPSKPQKSMYCSAPFICAMLNASNTNERSFYAEKHDRPHPGQLRRLRGLPRHGAHRRGAVLPADLLVRRAKPPRGRPQPLRAGGGEGEGAGLLEGPDLPNGALADRRQERAGSGGPGGVPEPHRRGLRRLPGKGRRGPGALPGPPPRRALQLHPRLPRERPHQKHHSERRIRP